MTTAAQDHNAHLDNVRVDRAASSSIIESSSCPLSDGEVVALLCDGLPYVVRKLPSLVDEKMVSTYVLELSRPDEGVSIADTATHLSAVVHGEWIGFRSAAAGGRLLQVRKRGTKRLCFFSTRFGTWEQFGIDLFDASTGYADDDRRLRSRHLATGDGGVEDARWTTMPLVLRSRRLEKFTLSVDVMRVPEELRPTRRMSTTTSTVDHHHLTRTKRKSARIDFSVDPVTRIVTPRTLTLPQADGDDAISGDGDGDNGDGTKPTADAPTMESVGGGVTQGGIMSAMSDLLVSEWSSFVLKEVRQRQALEKEMATLQEDLGGVYAAVMDEIARAREEGLERARLAVDEVGGIMKAVVDERKRAMELLRHSCSRKVRRGTLTKAVHRWHGMVRRTRGMKRSCFSVWKAQKRQMQLLSMALQRRWTKTESEVFKSWRLVCVDRRRNTAALRRATRARETRRLRRIVAGWGQYVADMKKLENSMLGLAMMRQSHAMMLSQTVRHWWQLVCVRRAGERKVAKRLNATRTRLMRATMRAWTSTARSHANGRAALRRMIRRSEQELARTAMHAWVIVCSVRGEATTSTNAAVTEAVASMEMQMEGLRALQVAFDAFRWNVRSAEHHRKLYLLVRRSVDKKRMREAFNEWQGYYEHLMSCRDDAANAIIKKEAMFCLRALLRWQQAARESRMKSASLELVAARLMRARGVNKQAVWTEWIRRVADAKDRRRMALVIACASDRSRRHILMSSKMSSWCKFAAARRRQRRIVSRCRATQLRNILSSSLNLWRAEVIRVAGRLECVRSCIKSKRLLMQWWMAWYWDSYEPDIRQALSSLYGNCEDTMDEIYQGKESPADVPGRSAFREWQRARGDVRASQDMKTIHHSGMTSTIMDGLERFYDGGDVTSKLSGGPDTRQSSDVDGFCSAILEQIAD